MSEDPVHHPGKTVARLLTSYNLSTAKAAKALMIRETVLTSVIEGRSPITLALSLRLSSFTRLKPEFWMKLQTDYDLYVFNQSPEARKIRDSVSSTIGKWEELQPRPTPEEIGLSNRIQNEKLRLLNPALASKKTQATLDAATVCLGLFEAYLGMRRHSPKNARFYKDTDPRSDGKQFTKQEFEIALEANTKSKFILNNFGNIAVSKATEYDGDYFSAFGKALKSGSNKIQEALKPGATFNVFHWKIQILVLLQENLSDVLKFKSERGEKWRAAFWKEITTSEKYPEITRYFGNNSSDEKNFLTLLKKIGF